MYEIPQLQECIYKNDMGNKMNSKQTLEFLKKDLTSFDKQRKLYSRQSEWLRIMYEKTIAVEMLETAISLVDEDNGK